MVRNGIVDASLNDSTYGSYCDIILRWELQSQSPANNTSTIYWEISISNTDNDNDLYEFRSYNVYVDNKTIAGKTVNNSATPLTYLYQGESDILASGTYTIPHNGDGTKSFTMDLGGYVRRLEHNSDGSWGGEGSIHGINYGAEETTFSLPTIERKATILTATNFTDEENPIITYSNPAGSDATKLEACISFTGGNDDIKYRSISKTGSSYTFNLTEDERNVLRVAAINAQTITVRFYLKTTIAGTTYFDYVTRNITIVSCNPVINNPTVKDIQSSILELTGDENTIVKHASMIEYSYEPVATKGAIIAEQYIQCGSKKITGLNQGVIDDVESGTFVFSVTDSRGLTTERVIEKPVVEYVKPTCYQAFDTELVGETGAKITLKISGNYFNGSFGAVSNELKIEVRHTQNDGTMGDWVNLTEGLIPVFNGNTYELEITISGFDYSQAYEFQSRVTDKLYTVQSSSYTVRLLPVFDWSEKDFNFNVPVNVNGETVLRHNKEANNTVLSASGGHIYVRPGGTDDTSSETIFYPDGSVDFSGEVRVNGEVLGGSADFIVETGTESMGTNGTWYWTKWNSGKAECYGKRNFGNMAVTTAWGGLYRSAALTQTLPSGLFNDIPEVISIDLINSSYGGWIARHEETAPTANNTGSFIVVRPASATITPSNIGINVIGRWK